MKRVLLATIYLLFFVCPCFSIEDTVALEEDHHCECHTHEHQQQIKVDDNSVLTLRDCISIGIQNSPIIKEFAYKLEIAKSNVGLAKSMYFPVLSAGTGYNQSFNSNKVDFYRNYRELPYVGVSLNQMIWNFGKTTADIRMEEFLKIAASYEFEDSVCSTVFDIKKHYYNLLKAKYLYEIEKMNYDLQKNLEVKIKTCKRDESITKAAILNAELELSKIKTNLLETERNYLNAKEELNNAMFFKNAPDFSVYNTQTFSFTPVNQNAVKMVNYKQTIGISKDDTIFKYEKYAYDNAVKIAYNNSPDIKALVATKNAMNQALLSVKRNYYPELKAGVGYDFVNSNKYSNNGLNIAVGMDASLNALRHKYDIKGAKAQLDLAETQITTFKDNLYFKVRENINLVDAAHKKLPVCKKQMGMAAKYFEQCVLNYEEGKIDQLELEDAKTEYIMSLVDYVNSQYEYNIALIKLEMSMHEHLVDYHDDAEHAANYHAGDENNTLGKLIRCGKKHKP